MITRIEEEVTKRILVLDGAMGTQIQGYKLTDADYRGEIVGVNFPDNIGPGKRQ